MKSPMMRVLFVSLAAVAAVVWVACVRQAKGKPVRVALDHQIPPPSPSGQTACEAIEGLAWKRAASGKAGIARASDRGLVQTLADGDEISLAFVGAHMFDIINKLAEEAANDQERRSVVCHVLNDAASRGVKVLRIWGTRKRVGFDAEIGESAHLLSLLLDENARRQQPLRFIVTLANHQAGYGAPDPERSLDDQADGPWRTPQFYLRGGWLADGGLEERIRVFGESRALASPYVIAWELVNELDTFRHIDGGRFDGSAAVGLRDEFLVPAATRLARTLPQPIMLGDIRGDREAYARWAPSVIDALPAWVRARLAWTSHVYVERGADPERDLHKLDVDLAIARRYRLPFILGELGQRVAGAADAFCQSAAKHDLEPVVRAVEKRGVRSMLVWGEGRCRLDVGGREMVIGAGSDSAELSRSDERTHALLWALRRR